MSTTTHPESLRDEPSPGATVRATRLRARRAARRRTSRRSWEELRPGFWLALAYAAGLTFARVIDVTEDGPAMLLFGTTFTALLVASALQRPRWFPMFLVAYLPFSRAYALPLLGITGANLTNLLIALGFVAGVVDRARRPRPLRLGRTEKLLIAYIAVASLSVLQTKAAGWSLMDVVQTYRSWLAPILFFFIVRGIARDRQDVWATIRVLAWTTVLVAAVTWFEGLDRSNRGTIEAARVKGLMGQANTMGAFLAYYGAPLLALAVTARTWRRGLPYLAGFLVAARATLFTFSRGAYLSVAAGSGTVLLFGNPLLLAAAGAGGVMAAAVFPGLVPDSMVDRMRSISERQVYEGQSVEQTLDKSSSHRLVIWRGAARMIVQNPLQGVGLGLFPYVIGHYTEVPIEEGEPTDAHNAFIRVAGEMGLPALALLVALLFAYLWLALVNYFRRRMIPDRPVALASLGSLAALFVSCMLGSRFSDECLIGNFWILMALLVVVDRLPGPRRRRRKAAWR